MVCVSLEPFFVRVTESQLTSNVSSITKECQVKKKRRGDGKREEPTSTEMPPMDPMLLRRPSLNCSGTSRLNTVSMFNGCSSAGKSCRLNHRQGAWYVG